MPGVLKAAPAAPLARRQRQALPWEARPAHTQAMPSGITDRRWLIVTRARWLHGAVFLVARLSSSRPPRQGLPCGQSLRADPWPGAHSQGEASMRKMAAE